MKNIIFLILTMALTAWCSYSYMTEPHWYGFAFCLTSAMLVGCWFMIVVDDIKKWLRDKED